MTAKSKTNETASSAKIDEAAYYRVDASTRFKAFGTGFGPSVETEVTGALLAKLLASEHAGKVASYSEV